ncbi:secreted protein, partial [Candidatus Thiomargarita nelsonii]
MTTHFAKLAVLIAAVFTSSQVLADYYRQQTIPAPTPSNTKACSIEVCQLARADMTLAKNQNDAFMALFTGNGLPCFCSTTSQDEVNFSESGNVDAIGSIVTLDLETIRLGRFDKVHGVYEVDAGYVIVDARIQKRHGQAEVEELFLFGEPKGKILKGHEL